MSRHSAYPDIKIVLDEALRLGGGTYVCPSPGAAVNFRHRCYKFRKAYYEAFRDARYDTLSFPRIEPGSCEVVINKTSLSGFFVPNEEPSSSFDDLAASIADKLKGDLL